jgi:hypothetical protein
MSFSVENVDRSGLDECWTARSAIALGGVASFVFEVFIHITVRASPKGAIT